MNGEKSRTRSEQRKMRPLEESSSTPVSRTMRRSRQEVNESIPSTKRTIWVQLKIIPIWLRILLVILLIAAAAVGGIIIGYGYVGEGDPANALKKETWIHILDIINGKESP